MCRLWDLWTGLKHDSIIPEVKSIFEYFWLDVFPQDVLYLKSNFQNSFGNMTSRWHHTVCFFFFFFFNWEGVGHGESILSEGEEK